MNLTQASKSVVVLMLAGLAGIGLQSGAANAVVAQDGPAAAIEAALASPDRPAADREQDARRKPAEPSCCRGSWARTAR